MPTDSCQQEVPSMPSMPSALIYSRVSSKDQEREGFSIPA